MTKLSPHILVEVFPPGEYLKEELEARDWSQQDLAEVMGRPIGVVNQIISGKKAITPDTAIELGAALGTSSDYWWNLESMYRMWVKKKKSDKSSDVIVRRARLRAFAPVSTMVKRGWIKKGSNIAELEANVLNFYGTISFDEPPKPLKVAARKSTTYNTATPSQVAWFRRARFLAESVPAAKFDHSKFVAAVGDVRMLAADPSQLAHLQPFLADLGVRLLIVAPIEKTRIDGAVVWLDDESPALVLSARYDRIDSIWHTICHELIHIKHRDAQHIDLEPADGEEPESPDEDVITRENRANAEGAALLISAEHFKSFLVRKYKQYTATHINQFAGLHKIHPGIVVGQLHHEYDLNPDNGVAYSRHRDLLLQGQVRQVLTASTLTDGWGFDPGCE